MPGEKVMTFDPTDNDQLLELKSEVIDNPGGRPYNQQIGSKTVIEVINRKDPAITVNKPVVLITIQELSGVIHDGEYAALSEYGKAFITAMIGQPADSSVLHYRDKFLDLFPAGSLTRSAANALRQTIGSRAEQLWGYGTYIERDHWRAARRA